MSKEQPAITIFHSELKSWLEDELEREPTEDELKQFIMWVQRDVPQFLTDNAKSFVRDRGPQEIILRGDKCTCGHYQGRHIDLEKEGDGLGRCAVHFCSCEKFEKADKQ